MARKAKQVLADIPPDNTLQVEQAPDEAPYAAMARKVLGPGFRHGAIAGGFAKGLFGDGVDLPGIMDNTRFMLAEGDKAVAGDMDLASRVLLSQALTLDSMFTELARRSAASMGDYPEAMERYMRLALKAQSNSRQTLEALTKLHQPREQVVRHIHVNEGGQAVIAEQFNHYSGGQQNGQSNGQPHAAGTGAIGGVPALLGQDPQGHGLPSPCGARGEAVPDARGQGKRRA